MKLNPIMVLREDFDDAAVLFNPDTGAILQLNKTGLFIVKAAEKGMSLEDIFDGLHKACGDTFKESSHSEIENFVEKLKKEGYIQD